MNHLPITEELACNGSIFQYLLSGLSEETYRWKPKPGKWCLLEVVCHLYDEEREDFRARVKHTLETPEAPMPPIDPVGWVTSRQYLDQDYETQIGAFLAERERSVQWLRSLSAPNWGNTYHHPTLGPLTAKLFLSNWLAHDYLHIRQIIGVKHAYLKDSSGELLTYAGNW